MISAAEAALHKDIHLYVRIAKDYYEQKDGELLETPFSNKAANDPDHTDVTYTLEQTLASDGSVLLTKYKGEDGYFRVEGLTAKTGYLTIEATLYMDETLPMVGNGFRLRNSSVNTPDSVGFGGDGTIKIGGVAVGTLTKTPTKYAFVFHEQEDGVGYNIDFYVNGVYQTTATHDIVVNGTTNEVDISTITILHWYFSKGNVGSMHIADLRVVDGFHLN